MPKLCQLDSRTCLGTPYEVHGLKTMPSRRYGISDLHPSRITRRSQIPSFNKTCIPVAGGYSIGNHYLLRDSVDLDGDVAWYILSLLNPVFGSWQS